MQTREEKLAYHRKYAAEHAIEARARARAWDAANREKVNARSLARYYANKEKRREINSRWQRTSPTRKAWKAANREKINAWYREYYRTNEAYRSHLREWSKRSPRRRALLAKWKAIGMLCYVCGHHLLESEITVDHVIPKKHGGTDDMRNIMPAHLRCNCKKNCRLDYPIARPDLLEVAYA